MAYENAINVNGVGFDIACGNKAVLLDVCADDIKSNIYRTMNEIQKHISFGVGRKNNEQVDHDLFDCPSWDELAILSSLKDKARAQLGTVGSGNHYVDIFTSTILNAFGLGVHFGSRGLGHSICTHFIKAAGGKDGVHAVPRSFLMKIQTSEPNTLNAWNSLVDMLMQGETGYAIELQKYLELTSSRKYTITITSPGRNDILIKISGLSEKEQLPPSQVKRALLGDLWEIYLSVLGRYRRGQLQTGALYSTIHGAGRSMGRTQAKGKTDRKTGKQLTEGLVKKSEHDDWMAKVGVELRGGGLDESPYAYKRIEEVLDAHKNTIKILHKLTPIGVAMKDEREKRSMERLENTYRI